ncbi:putative prenylcysteine lyase [Aspergillus lucknowensis]|uniref:Prenylcysteine lyase domain-containing protein n=1 Tax=Aspergillus lucknowensis TaxID=176173 RepID=A0ABR4LBA8_9EURO
MDFFSRARSWNWFLCIWALCYATALGFIPLPKLGAASPLGSAEPAPKQVAIIGAGAAGASTAYSLRKYAEESGTPLNVTVFERAAYVGGRSTTVNVFDDPAYPIELGASIFVKVNYNLVNASKELGLNVRGASSERPKEAEEVLGVWDGKQFVFAMEDSSSWWNIAKLIWRYGWAPVRTQNLMKSTVNKFLQLYDEPLFPFRSLTAAAVSVGLIDATSTPGATFLDEHNISPDFAREVIQASTRVNYGQNLPLIHGLESMVCMATDGAVSVEGGNWQIFDGMLKSARADVRLNHTVNAITRNPDNSVTIDYQDKFLRRIHRADFDEVVIAAPYQYSALTVKPPLEHTPDTIPFHTLHVTLFSSPHRLSWKYFNLKGPSERVPETVLTTLPRDTDLGNTEEGVGPAKFWSISTLRTVTAPSASSSSPDTPEETNEEPQPHYVYKIFSPTRPTANFIRDILGLEHPTPTPDTNTDADTESSIADLPREDISWSHEKVWHPYPFLYPRVTFEDPLLAPSVWYTGGIESFISTMETSALMGRNVAALIARSWEDRDLDEDGDGEVRGLDDAPVVVERVEL